MSILFCSRWVFKLTHATIIGIAVQILACECAYLYYFMTSVLVAVTNVGIGLGLLGKKYDLRTSFDSLWTFIGYVEFFILLQIVMHVVFIIIAHKAPPEGMSPLVLK